MEKQSDQGPPCWLSEIVNGHIGLRWKPQPKVFRRVSFKVKEVAYSLGHTQGNFTRLCFTLHSLINGSCGVGGTGQTWIYYVKRKVINVISRGTFYNG